MFADTDFILALIKSSDWLKGRAEILLKENKGRITTSPSVMIEVAIVCKRLGINITDAFANAFELVGVDEATYHTCLTASAYIEKDGLTVFDSFNAAYCGNDAIISSDDVYEKAGLERARLEKRL